MMSYRASPGDRGLLRRLRRASPAQVGLAAVELAIAYEWLLSGLDKCLSAGYLTGLPGALSETTQGNPNGWYVLVPPPGGDAELHRVRLSGRGG